MIKSSIDQFPVLQRNSSHTELKSQQEKFPFCESVQVDNNPRHFISYEYEFANLTSYLWLFYLQALWDDMEVELVTEEGMLEEDHFGVDDNNTVKILPFTFIWFHIHTYTLFPYIYVCIYSYIIW